MPEAKPNKIVNLDYLRLEVDTEQFLICLYWKRQVNSTELRTGFYTAVEVASAYGCKFWLGDARNTTMLDIADQEYLVKDLVTMISGSGIRKVARLVEEKEATVQESFSMKLKIETGHTGNIKFQTGIFTEEATARKWLFQE